MSLANKKPILERTKYVFLLDDDISGCWLPESDLELEFFKSGDYFRVDMENGDIFIFKVINPSHCYVDMSLQKGDGQEKYFGQKNIPSILYIGENFFLEGEDMGLVLRIQSLYKEIVPKNKWRYL